jgi:hypothetical protein
LKDLFHPHTSSAGQALFALRKEFDKVNIYKNNNGQMLLPLLGNNGEAFSRKGFPMWHHPARWQSPTMV